LPDLDGQIEEGGVQVNKEGSDLVDYKGTVTPSGGFIHLFFETM